MIKFKTVLKEGEPESYIINKLGSIVVELNDVALKTANQKAQQNLFDAKKLILDAISLFGK